VRSSLLLALAVLLPGGPVLAQTSTPVSMGALVETQPSLGSGSSIRGAALWVHPRTPAASQLLVADAQAGLLSYELNGAARPVLVGGSVVGVDVQDVVLDGLTQPLIVVANASVGLQSYVLNLGTLTAQKIGEDVSTGFTPNSVAVYAGDNGRLYAFAGSEAGSVAQFELSSQAADAGTGATVLRTINVGGPVTGLAVDDAQGVLYVMRQNDGILQYGAEPTSTAAPVRVDSISSSTGLVQPLGGLALYTAANNRGYLLAVNGGANTVRLYDRALTGRTYRGSFRVVQDGGIDAVDNPRYVAVSNRALGTLFPFGVVAVHDALDTGGRENFKLLDWSMLARGFGGTLVVDNGDPTNPDGGTSSDGGTDAGIVVPGRPEPPGPGAGRPVSDGCGCSSASLPGTVLFVLAGALLLSRRRSGA